MLLPVVVNELTIKGPTNQLVQKVFGTDTQQLEKAANSSNIKQQKLQKIFKIINSLDKGYSACNDDYISNIIVKTSTILALNLCFTINVSLRASFLRRSKEQKSSLSIEKAQTDEKNYEHISYCLWS